MEWELGISETARQASETGWGSKICNLIASGEAE